MDAAATAARRARRGLELARLCLSVSRTYLDRHIPVASATRCGFRSDQNMARGNSWARRALVPRLALFGLGYWVEGLVLLGAAWLAGIGLVLFLFAYVVHTPHESVGRYVDTSTILVEGFMGKIVTWLWLCQNYHSIHHLFPRVPFYRYPSVFREIEETMVTRGAPIYRFGLPGLELRRAPAG